MEGSQDRLLPIANVGRIMKQALPQNAKISKGTKERMQECATEFVSFVTGEASNMCRKDNRKTLNGEDICRALSALGFENLAESTSRYLYKFREFEREKNLNQLNNEDANLAALGHLPTASSGYHEENSADKEANELKSWNNEKSQCLGLHLQARRGNPTISFLGSLN